LCPTIPPVLSNKKMIKRNEKRTKPTKHKLCEPSMTTTTHDDTLCPPRRRLEDVPRTLGRRQPPPARRCRQSVEWGPFSLVRLLACLPACLPAYPSPYPTLMTKQRRAHFPICLSTPTRSAASSCPQSGPSRGSLAAGTSTEDP
jgi:hypothetical protein